MALHSKETVNLYGSSGSNVSNQRDATTFRLLVFINQPYMFRATNSPILSTIIRYNYIQIFGKPSTYFDLLFISPRMIVYSFIRGDINDCSYTGTYVCKRR